MRMTKAVPIGDVYADRTGQRWKCVPATFGQLPEFVNIETQTRAVRTHEGRYRFDGLDHPLDLIECIGESDE